MRRITVPFVLATVVLLGLAAAVGDRGSRAQDATLAPGPHPVVGSWFVTLAVRRDLV